MESDSIDTIIQPGMRYWLEYQEYERAHVAVIPALDQGPKPGRVRVDLATGQVVIDPESVIDPEPASRPTSDPR